jgi:hypothetical protein
MLSRNTFASWAREPYPRDAIPRTPVRKTHRHAGGFSWRRDAPHGRRDAFPMDYPTRIIPDAIYDFAQNPDKRSRRRLRAQRIKAK